MQELPEQASSEPSKQPQKELLGQQPGGLGDGIPREPSGHSVNKSERQPSKDESDENEESVDVQAEITDSSGVNFISGRDTKTGDVIKRDKIVNNFQIIVKGSKEWRRPPPPAADASLEEKVAHWFMNDLETPQQQLIVVTLSMFNDLRYEAFLRIYETIRDAIIKTSPEDQPGQDIKNIDVFLSDADKCRAIFEPDPKRLEEHIKFKEPECKDAVWRIVRRYRRALLLKLLPTLRQIGERPNWDIRARAAEAVAEIGKMGIEAIKTGVLEYWARDRRGYVRAAVGYTLSRLYADVKTRSAAIDILNEWSDPQRASADENWRLRWTVASAYKQIGFEDAQAAYSGLKKVALYPDIRVADSVIHTFVVLSLEQDRLISIVELLGKWAEEGTGGRGTDQDRDVVCRVAILAFLVLAQLHTETVEEEIDGDAEHFTARSSDLFQLVSENKNNVLWQTIVSMGTRAFESGLKDGYFEVIQLWSEKNAHPHASKHVLIELILELHKQSRPKYKELVWNRLSRWEQQSTNKNLASLAREAKERIRSTYQ